MTSLPRHSKRSPQVWGGDSPAPVVGISDAELLKKARKSDPDFGPLFDGQLDGRNASSADMALMNKLAFWLGRDPVRMEQAFSSSKLAERGKWTNRADYRCEHHRQGDRRLRESL